MDTSWSSDIYIVLDNIRLNCSVLSKAHKKRYFELKYSLNFYKLPVIVLNGCNSIISVGLQPYADQGTISLTTSLIALLCGIIGSIELYLGIQKRLESDIISSRDYYLLGIDIYKTLALNSENRPVPAKDYLNEVFNKYTKLTESSDALVKKIDDKLLPINLTEDNGDIKIVTPSESGSVNISNGRFDTHLDD